jgi:hypothetical protein
MHNPRPKFLSHQQFHAPTDFLDRPTKFYQTIRASISLHSCCFPWKFFGFSRDEMEKNLSILMLVWIHAIAAALIYFPISSVDLMIISIYVTGRGPISSKRSCGGLYRKIITRLQQSSVGYHECLGELVHDEGN